MDRSDRPELRQAPGSRPKAYHRQPTCRLVGCRSKATCLEIVVALGTWLTPRGYRASLRAEFRPVSTPASAPVAPLAVAASPMQRVALWFDEPRDKISNRGKAGARESGPLEVWAPAPEWVARLLCWS